MSDSFQVNLSRASSGQSWGFRLQGGVDFPTPLSIQSVTSASIADHSGLRTGDNILQINNVQVDQLAHEEAKRHIIMAGDSFSLVVKRGSLSVWKPLVTPTPISQLRGDPQLPPPEGAEEQYVQKTSLAASRGPGLPDINFYNRTARGFPGSGNIPPPSGATVPVVMNKQYNTPMGMYSTNSALEAFETQSDSLVQGVEGYEDQQHPQQQAPPHGYGAPAGQDPASGMRSVRAPTGQPSNVQQQQAQHMICKACGQLIIGVFVKVKGEMMHSDCYKCVRCNRSLKQQGFFTIEGQLHCEACATAVSAPPGGNMVAQAVYR